MSFIVIAVPFIFKSKVVIVRSARSNFRSIGGAYLWMYLYFTFVVDVRDVPVRRFRD